MCSAFFFYLSKAFDCVYHETLLCQLDMRGMCGLPIEWISSYLKDRYQRVQIANILSRKMKMAYGVPQDSILEPVLFVVDTIKADSFMDLKIQSIVELNAIVKHFSNKFLIGSKIIQR